MQPLEQEELNVIDQVLDQSMEVGLEVEVIYWALKAMQQNPALTPSAAMLLGVTEWIK
jgi:hypothetical protein